MDNSVMILNALKFSVSARALTGKKHHSILLFCKEVTDIYAQDGY